ncbi:MAG: metallophosphoesterase family protein [Bryobacterales bacterium]|nr:metallophosphoesterase family protein [Bryobacterales bacterium]MDE0292625.1 metallophosphoesterase family protein [Bryobacterales bacterium]
MRKVVTVVVALLVSFACGALQERATSPPSDFTHGPILGRLSSDGVGVWARTARPSEFLVRYGTARDQLTSTSDTVETTVDHDNTAWVHLTELKSNTKYFYELAMADSGTAGQGGSFHTLPSRNDVANSEHNPKGLFNFRFEFACGNNQRTGGGSNFGSALPTYTTMLRDLKRDEEHSRIDFAILNGDWLYEEKRDYPPDEWLRQVGIEAGQKPRIVDIAPTIVGVWENYKHYFNEAPNLAKWHSSIPSFFTFDDHEIVNDVYGAAEVGRRNRRPVFRDIGVQAWYDYLGWSNPIPHEQRIHFGKAQFKADSDVLTDASADFTKLNLDEAATLHVHWGTPDAGVMQGPSDTEGGDPNSAVYEIVEVLDANRLRLRPSAVADGEASYSIGQMSHFKMSVSNADLFFLDTRTFRDMHDVAKATEPGRSMLGSRQKKWLKDEMAASDADFFFVVSSVNFTIPHVGGTGAPIPTENKDDAWTVFLAERQELIDFWDGLDKPVFVLTGDLHNSFAIKITDRVWEFASGPHNSANHPAGSEGNRPPTGVYDSRGLPVEIRWSTYILNDTPQKLRRKPIFCVVQVNSVFNNPNEEGKDRWVAFPNPQVVFQYHDGLTGELLYAESVVAR